MFKSTPDPSALKVKKYESIAATIEYGIGPNGVK